MYIVYSKGINVLYICYVSVSFCDASKLVSVFTIIIFLDADLLRVTLCLGNKTVETRHKRHNEQIKEFESLSP